MSTILYALRATPPLLQVRCPCGREYQTAVAYVAAKRRQHCRACRPGRSAAHRLRVNGRFA